MMRSGRLNSFGIPDMTISLQDEKGRPPGDTAGPGLQRRGQSQLEEEKAKSPERQTWGKRPQRTDGRLRPREGRDLSPGCINGHLLNTY